MHIIGFRLGILCTFDNWSAAAMILFIWAIARRRGPQEQYDHGSIHSVQLTCCFEAPTPFFSAT